MAAAPTPPWVVAIAASLGGVQALRQVLGAMPSDLPAAIVIVLHRPPHAKSHLVEILARVSPFPVVEARDGDLLQQGVVYVARADRHLVVTAERRFRHQDGRKISFTSSSANPLFESASKAFDGHLIAVVLTGGGSDGTDGVRFVKAHGGTVIAQDHATSENWSMPASAIRTGSVDRVLPLDAIGPAIERVVRTSDRLLEAKIS